MSVDLLRDGLIRATDTVPVHVVEASPAEADAAPCHLCGKATTTHCVNCERAACEEDRWVMYGLCRECLPDEDVRRAAAPADRTRPDLGIKWVED